MFVNELGIILDLFDVVSRVSYFQLLLGRSFAGIRIALSGRRQGRSEVNIMGEIRFLDGAERRNDSSSVGYAGLCSTCRFAEECKPTTGAGSAVNFCEEFQVEHTPVRRSTGISSGSLDKPRLEGVAGQYKGLCIDCRNNTTCTFPKTEGGVWHCEEYS